MKPTSVCSLVLIAVLILPAHRGWEARALSSGIAGTMDSLGGLEFSQTATLKGVGVL